MRVSGLLKAKGTAVHTIAGDASVIEAASLLDGLHVGCLVVLDPRGRPAGLVTERSITRALAQHGEAAISLPTRAVMEGELPTCAPNDTLEHVMAEMTSRRTRHLPVFDGSQMVGLLSIGDVVKRRLVELEEEAQLVADYVTWGR